MLDSGDRRATLSAASEDRPIDLNAAIEPYVGAPSSGSASRSSSSSSWSSSRRAGSRRLGRRLDGITRGADGRSLEAVLDAHLDKVFSVARELDELSARSAMLEATRPAGRSSGSASSGSTRSRRPAATRASRSR